MHCALVTSDWAQPRKVPREQKGPGEILQQAECTGLQSPRWLPGLEAPLGSGQHRPQTQMKRQRQTVFAQRGEDDPAKTLCRVTRLSSTQSQVTSSDKGHGLSALTSLTIDTPPSGVPIWPSCHGPSSALFPWPSTLCPYTQVTWNMAPQPGQWRENRDRSGHLLELTGVAQVLDKGSASLHKKT